MEILIAIIVILIIEVFLWAFIGDIIDPHGKGKRRIDWILGKFK